MVFETEGDKRVRFSPNILQASRGYNVVVLQRTGPACLSFGPAVIANTIQAPYWWINSFMTKRQSGP